jgi:hypothetical protein
MRPGRGPISFSVMRCEPCRHRPLLTAILTEDGFSFVTSRAATATRERPSGGPARGLANNCHISDSRPPYDRRSCWRGSVGLGSPPLRLTRGRNRLGRSQMNSRAFTASVAVSLFVVTFGISLWLLWPGDGAEALPLPKSAATRAVAIRAPRSPFEQPTIPAAVVTAGARSATTLLAAQPPAVRLSVTQDDSQNTQRTNADAAPAGGRPGQEREDQEVPVLLYGHRDSDGAAGKIILRNTSDEPLNLTVTTPSTSLLVSLEPGQKRNLGEMGFAAAPGDRVTFHSPPYRDQTISMP